MDQAIQMKVLRSSDGYEGGGADIVMIKLTMMPYPDIIFNINQFSIPVFAYQVSGEYAMIRAAADAGYLNHKDAGGISIINQKIWCIRNFDIQRYRYRSMAQVITINQTSMG